MNIQSFKKINLFTFLLKHSFILAMILLLIGVTASSYYLYRILFSAIDNVQIAESQIIEYQSTNLQLQQFQTVVLKHIEKTESAKKSFETISHNPFLPENEQKIQ